MDRRQRGLPPLPDRTTEIARLLTPAILKIHFRRNHMEPPHVSPSDLSPSFPLDHSAPQSEGTTSGEWLTGREKGKNSQ